MFDRLKSLYYFRSTILGFVNVLSEPDLQLLNISDAVRYCKIVKSKGILATHVSNIKTNFNRDPDVKNMSIERMSLQLGDAGRHLAMQ